MIRRKNYDQDLVDVRNKLEYFQSEIRGMIKRLNKKIRETAKTEVIK
jgi:rhodanese-related sulfurtransferase